ncbi:hypothetical protein FEK30_07660 [Picosynechococcus sp. PCC 11901]|uniref:PH domain-containing protein n=1 Tax=Picosynechococcus sp. PCC 11901 TaxID=2579791 RepID=UPI0010FBE86A|nr:PH domain-containing protein [Picosynechococcus sp. PCC 11901]QCS49325.1 hypothetical protein FEK30_07660 [Picosynechococcus sp. PCC 11901]
MENSLFFKAPWSQTLITITILVCVVLLAMVLLFLILGLQQQNPYFLLWIILPIGIVVMTALFMVRGYHLDGDRLYVERLGWRTEIALENLESATYDPTAMDGSLRLFGNGGLFAFTGKFWNKNLGHYNAYATAVRLAVVLKWPNQTIVVTPEKPEQFVAAILRR